MQYSRQEVTLDFYMENFGLGVIKESRVIDGDLLVTTLGYGFAGAFVPVMEVEITQKVRRFRGNYEMAEHVSTQYFRIVAEHD